MITQKAIMQKVRAYAASPAGKKAIKKQYGVEYNPKKDDGGVDAALRKMHTVASKAREILHRHISVVINSIQIDDIVIGDPFVDKAGMARITLSFKEDALFRPSLQSNKYSRGVEDIVLHFTHGWSAGGSVFGRWHGTPTWSRRAKLPDNFLLLAIEEINLYIKGTATADLKGEYVK